MLKELNLAADAFDDFKKGLGGYSSPSGYVPTNEDVDFLIKLCKADILKKSSVIDELRHSGPAFASITPKVRVGDVYGYLKIELSHMQADALDEQQNSLLRFKIKWLNDHTEDECANARAMEFIKEVERLAADPANWDIACRAAKIIEKYHLPEITGVSEKQIKYASDLRSKELLSKEPEIIAAYAFWEKVHADPNHPERWKLQKIANKKTNGDVEVFYNWFLTRYRCEKLNAIWHTSSARKIIDELLKD